MKRRKRTVRYERAPKKILLLGFPGSQILDITGPYQVFVRAAEIYLRTNPQPEPPYQVLLASTTRNKTITTNCGLSLTAAETFRSVRGPVHTLLVAGGSGVENAILDKAVWRHRKTL